MRSFVAACLDAADAAGASYADVRVVDTQHRGPLRADGAGRGRVHRAAPSASACVSSPTAPGASRPPRSSPTTRPSGSPARPSRSRAPARSSAGSPGRAVSAGPAGRRLVGPLRDRPVQHLHRDEARAACSRPTRRSAPRRPCASRTLTWTSCTSTRSSGPRWARTWSRTSTRPARGSSRTPSATRSCRAPIPTPTAASTCRAAGRPSRRWTSTGNAPRVAAEAVAAAHREAVPVHRDDRHHRRLPARAPGPRVDRTSDRAGPGARRGGRLRGDLVPHAE